MTVTTAAPVATTQLVLPGQAGAPDGPVDLFMMFVMHHAFRRDLTSFAAAAAATPSSDRRTWRALAERWDVFSTVLHHHHTGEDTGLWPLLLQRVDAVGDTEARATLEAMEAEHAEIDPLLQACAAGFARLAEADDDLARSALAATLVAAREHLAGHLRHEECDALRIVQEHLTQQDWDHMEEESFGRDISGRERLRLIPWVLHDLPPAGLERLLAKPGAKVMLALYRVALRRGYERRERRAFAYVR